MEKINVNLPYPPLSEIEEDQYSAMIIAPAYTGLRGELSSVLQYGYHGYYFDSDIGEAVKGISLCEMEHFKLIGNLLKKLGCDPVYTIIPPSKYNFYNTSAVSYSKSPQKMLLDDVAMEMNAINDYEFMNKKLKNEKVSAVISRIILDEELHIKVLREKLKSIT